MNHLKYPFTLLLLICALHSHAQHSTIIKLSDSTPNASENLTVSYRPMAKNAIIGKAKALVYVLDNQLSPAQDITLHKKGNRISGSFRLPVHTKAFCIRLDYKNHENKPVTDTYVFPVYLKKTPVDGAYANAAFATGLAAEMFGVKKDLESAAILYKKEFELHPMLEGDYEDLYLLTLLYTNPNNQRLAIRKAETFAKSGNEKQMIFALNYYEHARDKKKSDSLQNVILKLYPGGELNHTNLVTAFENQTDATKKDSLYNVLGLYHTSNSYQARWERDDLKRKMAIANLQAGDMPGFNKWVSQVQDKFYLPGAINDVVTSWLMSDINLNLSDLAIENTLAILRMLLKNKSPESYKSPLQLQSDNQDTYNACLDTYGQILLKKGDIKKAMSFEKIAYNRFHMLDTMVTAHYAAALNAGNYPRNAQQIIERCLLAGKNSLALKKQAEVSFIKIHGSSYGFDKYYDVISKASGNQDLSNKVEEMINVPAPDFDLKDLSGNHITLASLKGKITVIDFWASWCAPCKNSFPGMELAINKYRDHPDVRFIFLDTWENGTDYVDNANKFMQANKYDFTVIFDENAGDNRMSKVRAAYNVNGLPTKILIDKNGNIRFIATGYGGSAQSVVDEVSSMIEILEKENL